jgi:hypothetical protein
MTSEAERFLNAVVGHLLKYAEVNGDVEAMQFLRGSVALGPLKVDMHGCNIFDAAGNKLIKDVFVKER